MHIHWWSWKAQGLGFWEESVKNKTSWELVSERKRGSEKVVSSGDSGIEACCCYIKAIIFLFKVFVHIQNHTESHKILIAFYPRQQWKNKRKLCQAAPGKVQVGHKEELDRAVKHWNGLQRRWWSHHPQMYSKKSWMWHLVLWSIWRSGDQSKVGFNDCVIGAKILQLQYDPGRQMNGAKCSWGMPRDLRWSCKCRPDLTVGLLSLGSRDFCGKGKLAAS